jgi:hypothetical protein
MDEQPSECSLSAAATYRLGGATLVEFRIRNTSNQAYQLLTWGTPLEDDAATSFLTVYRDDELLEYDGRLVKQGEPVDRDYVTLGPVGVAHQGSRYLPALSDHAAW